MSDAARRMRLLGALRDAVTERYRTGGGGRDPLDRGRLARRHRDCVSLVRLGVPATEARGLARRLDAALDLGVGDDAAGQDALALDLTRLLVDLYAEFLDLGDPLRPG